MPKRPPVFRPRGARTAQAVDRQRGTPEERGYTWAWKKAADAHLARHPLCRYCELEGRTTAATLVDHVYPHRTFRGVFWLTLYWASSCGPCHSGFKQRVERAGRAALDALATRLGLPPLPAG